MKIGIITCWQSLDNYGQQLQCFALQSLLRGWGHDAFLIRYSPEKRKASIWTRVKSYCFHPKYLFHHLPFETGIKKNYIAEKRLVKSNILNNPLRGFENFRVQNLKMTDTIYKSSGELIANPPSADAYITGSDQVWHDPFFESDALGWFLQFGSKQTKRISYAASIGRMVSQKELPLFRNFLSLFDAISVREESARTQCLELGFDAQVCMDPTLLLDVSDYKKIAKRISFTRKYAFFYILNVRNSDDFFWKQIKEYIDDIGLVIVSVTGSGYYPARELIENNNNIWASIPEWIGYIDSADCVFTTSYHGTVFSILMHRPFLTIGLKGKFSGANTRLEQLLYQLGIPERMLDPNKPIRQQMESYIDWEAIDKKIKLLQIPSIAFLKENLNMGEDALLI